MAVDVEAFITELKNAIGTDFVLDAPEDRLPFETDWRGLYHDDSLCAMLPANTDEVAAAITICRRHGVHIVPQAGNSGLSGASTPVTIDSNGNKISHQAVLSVKRMNQIEDIDTTGNTMLVQAGCILENLQNAAWEANRFFPLNLGARGSCQIGGNISTNAGGVNVLAYGNTRALVLGLEVVLADGSIWSNLSRLHKDNAGLDLKHLFIGGEGLLGVITKAVVKISPKPTHKLTVFSALESPGDGVALLNKLKDASQGLLTSIELMPRVFIDRGKIAVPGLRDPFDAPYPWYVLSEHSFFGDDQSKLTADADTLAETLYGRLLENGTLLDAAIAQSEQQAADLWLIREGTTPSQASLGASIKHDVSVGIADVPELIHRGIEALELVVPGCIPLPFGHLGDGNMHFNVCQPQDMDPEEFRSHLGAVNRCVHDIVVDLNGSISAEHGIGRLRRAELARTKDPVALQIMRQIKSALDPEGLFNPGKVI